MQLVGGARHGCLPRLKPARCLHELLSRCPRCLGVAGWHLGIPWSGQQPTGPDKSHKHMHNPKIPALCSHPQLPQPHACSRPTCAAASTLRCLSRVVHAAGPTSTLQCTAGGGLAFLRVAGDLQRTLSFLCGHTSSAVCPPLPLTPSQAALGNAAAGKQSSNPCSRGALGQSGAENRTQAKQRHSNRAAASMADVSDEGTDDDLPPSYPNRSIRGSGRVSGNGRAIVPASSYARAPTDMEAQIQQLEQEAYCSVLRAFKAQSDAITWEKEGLMTELRKELRVSDKAHRELLNRVNNDNIICSIREWRSTGGLQATLSNNPQPIHDPVPSPTTSGRKRQKTSQSVPALTAPPPVMHSQQLATPMQPSSSTARKAVPQGSKGKKSKPGQKVPGGPAAKPISSSAGPSGRGPHMNRNFPGGPAEAQAQNVDPLIGRKVMSRWPEDNSFYEAVISDYNVETGLYALVYDMNTANETWEWVDLKEMGPEDIRWQEDDSGIDPVTYLRSRGAPTSGGRKPAGRGGPMPGPGRGRGFQKNMSKKDFPPPQNGVGKRSSDDIDILHTESLIKEVEKVFSVSNPDPQEVEKAKKVLKEQEQSLIDAIARLAEASDGESDGHNRGRRNSLYAGNQHQANYADVMPVDGDQADAM